MTGARPALTAVHQPLPHDSARLHVTGEARFIDDLPEPRGMLHLAVARSEHAHARIKKINLTPVRAAADVVRVLGAADITGANDISPKGLGDDPVFADGLVKFYGQALFAVAATDRDSARRAARLAEVDYEPLPAVLSLEQAVAREEYVAPPLLLERGDAARAIAKSGHKIKGRLCSGGQDHFYLEGQIALAVPGEDGAMFVRSSTQHPAEVQHLVAQALGIADGAVTVEVRRMGGGFGGKETQAAQWAVIAALAARACNAPAKLRLDRDDDMVMTGKRHPFVSDYQAGFDGSGRVNGLALTFTADCGFSADLSGAVNDRAVLHADNAYYLENVSIRSRRCRTNTVSNTAFRGFGAPQGMLVVERVMEHIAAHLGMDALAVRRKNLYGIRRRNTTPFGMTVSDNALPRIISRLATTASYQKRRAAVINFNRAHATRKKGIALAPVKFGIAFTTTFMNQGGALLQVYTDGSVHVNHGGAEMGQGLFIKVAQVVADELQVDIGAVHLSATRTDKVPNTPATAASSGADLNCMAALAAARKIKKRLTKVAAQSCGVAESAVVFHRGGVAAGKTRLSFAALARRAWLARVPLSATGFYRTPKIHWDAKQKRGRPFLYFAYGAAVAEVVVDTLSGESKVERVDILHDAGRSLNPAVDRGQIEGGFVQGLGWLTTEELWWDAAGRLQTHAPSTYKIPACADLPADFRVEIFAAGRNREPTVHRSKAVGEPPLMLAIAVFNALAQAAAAVHGERAPPTVDAPATPERLLLAMQKPGPA